MSSGTIFKVGGTSARQTN